MLRQDQVTGKRIKDMLPRPDGLRVSYLDSNSAESRAHQIGNQTVDGPISAADDVACAGGCNGRCIASTEERRTVRCGHQFSAGLATAIRIAAALRFVLSVSPFPLAVLITLVARHN